MNGIGGMGGGIEQAIQQMLAAAMRSSDVAKDEAAFAERTEQDGPPINFVPNQGYPLDPSSGQAPPQSSPAQLAAQYIATIMGQQTPAQTQLSVPVPGGNGSSQLPSFAMPQARNQPGVPSGDYDQDKFERRKAAVGRLAQAREERPRPTPMQSPFDLIRNTAVQGINQLVADSFSPSFGMGGMTPEMVMAYQNRMPLLSQLTTGVGVPSQGGSQTAWGRPQQQQAPKQVTIKDLDDSQLNWYNAQLKTKLAGIAEQAAREKDKNRKQYLQQQHDKLLEQQRQFDEELDLREKKVAQGDRSLDIRESGQKQKAETEEAKATVSKDKTFHARLDAITNPLDPSGRPVGLSPDALPLFEMLKIQYEAMGESKYVDILDKLIEKIKVLKPEAAPPPPTQAAPGTVSGGRLQ